MEIHELIPEGPWDDESEPYQPSEQDRHEDALTAHEAERPMPWCEHCQSYHHTTAEHITRTVTIDITPVGCQTAEGIKRVRDAQQEWDSATHDLANYLKTVVDKIFYTDGNKIARAEYYSKLQTLIGIREVRQEAFLRAVIGQPDRPPKVKLHLYPVTVNSKTVNVTIPED